MTCAGVGLDLGNELDWGESENQKQGTVVVGAVCFEVKGLVTDFGLGWMLIKVELQASPLLRPDVFDAHLVNIDIAMHRQFNRPKPDRNRHISRLHPNATRFALRMKYECSLI